MKRFIAALSLLLSISTARAATEPVHILVEDSWPPFAFKSGNTPIGMSIDIVREAFKNVDEDIKLVQVPYPRCLAQTANGRFPACFNSAHSKEMDADFLFPKEPLFKSKGLILANSISARAHITRVRDLEGKTVGLPTGFPFGKEFDENNRINKVFTANDRTSLLMLRSNRVSYVAIDEYVYYYYLKNNPDFRGKFQIVLGLSEEPIFVHFAKKNKDAEMLLKKFEIGLTMLKNSTKYSEILDSWVGLEGQKRVQMFTFKPHMHAMEQKPFYENAENATY